MKVNKGPSDKTGKGGVRAYARHRGVAPNAVEEALKAGRISRDSKGKIDFAKADQAWERNTRPQAPHMTHKPRIAPAASSGPAFPGEEEALAGSAPYVKARAVREFYQASLARVEYEERVGKLVSKDEVSAAAFSRFRQFREQMLNILTGLRLSLRRKAIYGSATRY